MANKKEFIRKLAPLKSTPRNKGLTLDIKVTLSDNGGISVNGHDYTSEGSNALLAAGTQILQMLQILGEEHQKRMAKVQS